MPFVKYSMVVIAATWVVFSMSHPDTYIAEYNLSMKTGERYVLEELSDDAVPVIMKYEAGLYSTEHIDDIKRFNYRHANYELPKDFRKFNFAKYNAVKALANK